MKIEFDSVDTLIAFDIHKKCIDNKYDYIFPNHAVLYSAKPDTHHQMALNKYLFHRNQLGHKSMVLVSLCHQSS